MYREPSLEQGEIGLIAGSEVGGNQIVLALEMIVERLLGDARLLGDRIHADGADAFLIEQPVCDVDDAFARLNAFGYLETHK